MDSSKTVEQFKEEVYQREGIPVDQQRLIFAGIELKNERKMLSYCIQVESVLLILLKTN